MNGLGNIVESSFINIELGAGCGNFGEQYFPRCYTTEVASNLNCDMAHIHHYCSAYNTGLTSDRFTTVVMSNPFGYGFKEVENAQTLIDELYRLLQQNGKIVIICHETNRFCAPDRIEKRLNDDLGFIPIRRPILIEEIDHAVEYPGFEFKQVSGVPTKPNRRITLDVIK